MDRRFVRHRGGRRESDKAGRGLSRVVGRGRSELRLTMRLVSDVGLIAYRMRNVPYGA